MEIRSLKRSKQNQQQNSSKNVKRPRLSQNSKQNIQQQIQKLSQNHWNIHVLNHTISENLSLSTYLYSQFINTTNEHIVISTLHNEDFLQNHLWPFIVEIANKTKSENTSLHSFHHHPLFLLIRLFNYRQENNSDLIEQYLNTFNHNQSTFSFCIQQLFHDSCSTLSTNEKCLRLNFIAYVFRYLDYKHIQETLFPLVSLPIWLNLSETATKSVLLDFPHLTKPLEKLRRRDKRRKTKQTVPLSHTAFMSIVQNLERETSHLLQDNCEETIQILIAICHLLSEMLSNLTIRKTIFPLLTDRSTLPLLQSLTMEKYLNSQQLPGAWEMWLETLKNFGLVMTFPVESVNGSLVNRDAVRIERSKRLLRLQRVAYKICQREKFPDNHPLSEFCLRSHRDISNKNDLLGVLSSIPSEIVAEIIHVLDLFDPSRIYQEDKMNINMKDESLDTPTIHRIKVGMIASYCCVEQDATENMRSSPLMIDESDLWHQRDSSADLERGFLPALGINFLSIQDYLIRNYELHKRECSWAIKNDIQDIISKLVTEEKSKSSAVHDSTKSIVSVMSVISTTIGETALDSDAPSFIELKIEYDDRKLPSTFRQQWENLQDKEPIFLLSPNIHFQVDQPKNFAGLEENQNISRQKYIVRGIIVNKVEKENTFEENLSTKKTRKYIHGFVDPVRYSTDVKTFENVIQDIFNNDSILVKRYPQQSNFLPMLKTLRQLVLHPNLCIPQSLEDIILGKSTRHQLENYNELAVQEGNRVRDLFVSFDHLISLFPGIQTPAEDQEGAINQQSYFYISQQEEKDKIILSSHQLKTNSRSRYSILAGKCAQNTIQFYDNQVQAILSAMQSGITLISGPPGTGKTSCLTQIISSLYHTHEKQRILIIARTNHALDAILEQIKSYIPPFVIARLGHGDAETTSNESFLKQERIKFLLQKRRQLLHVAHEFAKSLDLSIHELEEWSCEYAMNLHKNEVEPQWEDFVKNTSQDWEKFPFTSFFEKTSEATGSDQAFEITKVTVAKSKNAQQAYSLIQQVFDDLATLQFLEVLQNNKQRENYLMARFAKVVAMTGTHAALQRNDLIAQGFAFDTLIIEEAGELLDIETFIPMTIQNPAQKSKERCLNRVIFVGDHRQLSPVVQNQDLRNFSNYGQSMFKRLIRAGNPVVELTIQCRSRKSITDLYRWRYPSLTDMKLGLEDSRFSLANPGLAFTSQFINVGDLDSELQPSPHYFQNHTEAEYIAFVYIYLIMLGYPSHKIAILTTYNGQVTMLKDVVHTRAKQNGITDLSCMFSTVDKFQGQQADYVLLSLVRTKALGHFQDVRRMTVALSRARLGLYIFGYHPLFASSPYMNQVFQILESSKKLTLYGGETYSTCERTESQKIETNSPLCRPVQSSKDMASIINYQRKMTNT